MPHVITEPCIGVKDGACVDICPVHCIGVSEDSPQFYIDPGSCIDCRACERFCPVHAIFGTYDLPQKWAEYRAINEAFFRK